MQRYYFDHNATTPVARELLLILVPVLADDWGNASSIHHFGQQARGKLDQARRQTAGTPGRRCQGDRLHQGGEHGAGQPGPVRGAPPRLRRPPGTSSPPRSNTWLS